MTDSLPRIISLTVAITFSSDDSGSFLIAEVATSLCMLMVVAGD
jgi:hypothetical protein